MKIRKCRPQALVAALVIATAASAAEAPSRFERSIQPRAGRNRLAVDLDLLAGARPLRYDAQGEFRGGLDDLRLFDRNGREVPYLIVPPPDREPEWRRATLLPIPTTKTTSGFEADFGRPFAVDRVRIEGLPFPFMKRCRLEGSGDRARWTVLASEATLFDLPDESLKQIAVAIPPGEYRYLRVVWNDASSARMPLPGRVEARIHRADAPLQTLRFTRPVEIVESEPRRSRFRIRLPAAALPVVKLEVTVDRGHVMRKATVTEARFDQREITPVTLGEAIIRRAERSEGVAAEMAVAIRRPETPELELVIENGDNPPLNVTSVTLETTPLPSIYFESADEAPLKARYGDATLEAPRYDLEAMRRFLGAASVAEAAWGEVKAVRPEQEVATGTPAGRGATIDRDDFEVARALPPTRKGLNALLLDAAVLASSATLSDLRIADASGRQVPYVLEKRGEPLVVKLGIPKQTTVDRTSRYEFELPYSRLPEARLVLTTSSRLFERQVKLISIRDSGEERGLASETWRHADPHRPAPPLTLPVAAGLDSRRIRVDVDEGDNEPVALTKIELLLPAYRLRFFSDGNERLTLHYGSPAAAAPRYDLSLLAPRLLSLPAHEIRLAVADRAGVESRRTRQRWIFWGFLGATVVALIVLLVRLIPGPSQQT